MGKIAETVGDMLITIVDEQVSIIGFGQDLDLVDYQIRDDIRYAHTPDEILGGDGPVVYIPHCGRHGFPQEMGQHMAGQIVTAVLLATPENWQQAFQTAHLYAEFQIPTQIIVCRMTATDEELDRGVNHIGHDDLIDYMVTTPVALRLDRITLERNERPVVRLNDVMIQRLLAMVEADEMEQLHLAMSNS